MNSLKFSKKYLILFLIILVLFGYLLAYFKYPQKETKENNTTNNQVNQTTNNPIFQNSSQRAQKEMISPRDAQIENYVNFPDQFPSASFGDRLFHLVFYYNSDYVRAKVPNFEGKYGVRAGVIVYEDKQKIWESTENFQELYDRSAEFKDITGDGVPEIIVIDDGGGNGVSCGTNVYKWNENTFQLITPPDTEDGINPCNGADATKGGFKDIDNNGVMELIDFRWDKAYPNLPESDSRFYATKEIEQIYKFNGTKYVFSKEIPTGVIRND